MGIQDFLKYVEITLDYLGIVTPQDLLEAVLLLAGSVLTGLVLSEILIYLWEIRTAIHQDLSTFRETLERRLPIAKGIEERRGKMRGEIEEIDQEIQKITSQQSTLAAELRQIQDMQSRVVRTIGAPTTGLKCFRALVLNDYVRGYVNEGKVHPMYDDSWASAQIVEVWSSSQAFALLVLRQKYAQAQGFTVDKIEPVQSVTEQSL